jgi:diadenosine tetraphosphate (Ap4A) HIT family hydrolase
MHCVNCEQHSRLALLPARDRIHLGRYWRLAHAWSALPGWLVLISRRHVLDLAELTEEESTELGQLLRQASGALGVVVGCIKTYVMFFAEQPGFEHLHIHLVPRMPNFDKHHLGSGVFDFLKRPESEWVPVEARDQLASELAEAMRLRSTRIQPENGSTTRMRNRRRQLRGRSSLLPQVRVSLRRPTPSPAARQRQ